MTDSIIRTDRLSHFFADCSMQILFDRDLASALPMEKAISAVRSFFESALNGGVVSPPRHSLNLENGGLTFTIGAETSISKTLGFRVYDTFGCGKK